MLPVPVPAGPDRVVSDRGGPDQAALGQAALDRVVPGQEVSGQATSDQGPDPVGLGRACLRSRWLNLLQRKAPRLRPSRLPPAAAATRIPR